MVLILVGAREAAQGLQVIHPHGLPIKFWLLAPSATSKRKADRTPIETPTDTGDVPQPGAPCRRKGSHHRDGYLTRNQRVDMERPKRRTTGLGRPSVTLSFEQMLLTA